MQGTPFFPSLLTSVTDSGKVTNICPMENIHGADYIGVSYFFLTQLLRKSLPFSDKLLNFVDRR